jgi:hypothetical protein
VGALTTKKQKETRPLVIRKRKCAGMVLIPSSTSQIISTGAPKSCSSVIALGWPIDGGSKTAEAPWSQGNIKATKGARRRPRCVMSPLRQRVGRKFTWMGNVALPCHAKCHEDVTKSWLARLTNQAEGWPCRSIPRIVGGPVSGPNSSLTEDGPEHWMAYQHRPDSKCASIFSGDAEYKVL